jgi:hypothetical protein
MTKDEALKLAIGKIKSARDCHFAAIDPLLFEAEEILEQALAAPVQEPVAWMHVMDNTEGIKANGKGIVSITQKQKHPFGKPGVDFSKSFPVTSTPLYTTPPAAQRQWVGLTDEDWKELHLTTNARTYGPAIEAKLKEKNCG